MIRKIITCDSFLDVCLTISVENINGYILGQNWFFILELNLFYVIGLKKKKNKTEIGVCCFNCVNYMVCLINNGGIENRILIKCNRTDLRDNYAIPFTDDYVSDTDSDSIAQFEEVDGLYYNQLH